jgi:acid phosphatase
VAVISSEKLLLTELETTWNSIYLPPILSRLEKLIDGNLNFTTTDVSIMPYLCGFESQITGTLSPWCSVFTDKELTQYEYAQDLRYYYGMGPGEDLPSKMMLPYLNALVGILDQGPGVNGTFANGSIYALPNIITAFMNDGQITELGAATGVWDDTTVLSGTEIPDKYKYIASHFVTMRGTVAFERLNCADKLYIRILLNDVVYPVPGCKDGPGNSCLLSKYVALVKSKMSAAGNLVERCNVTAANTPTAMKGASFFTNLSNPWLASIIP